MSPYKSFLLCKVLNFVSAGLTATEQQHPLTDEAKNILKPPVKHSPPELKSFYVGVSGECFQVDVGVEYPDETGLDFGNLRVGEKQTRTFDIVNYGKYPLRYEFKIKKKSILDLLKIENINRENVEPGERRTVTVTCCSKRQIKIVDAPELHLRVIDANSNEKVEPSLPPIKVSCQAVYNGYTVTPPRGLNLILCAVQKDS